MGKKKILAFAGSNSSKSINKQLVTFASSLIEEADVTLVDLKDFDLPIYGMDHELEHGIPHAAMRFKELVKSHHGIILSLAEHNGAYSAVFKNLFDWISRIEGKAWDNKPISLLSTSPGKRGGSSVLNMAANRFPYNGALVVNTYSLPSFHENFSEGQGIIDPGKLKELSEKIGALEQVLS